ncbi:MAG: hypothetical protein K0R17_2955 [Rariglobus sp.]|nr:hypothetical protein [Rariglobus sp.]
MWALVVFLGLGFLCRGASTRWIAGGSLCLAWAVECLQLYHAGWIDGIRATLLGRLILGSTFNAPDLVAYAIGIALGALAEWVYRARAVQT